MDFDDVSDLDDHRELLYKFADAVVQHLKSLIRSTRTTFGMCSNSQSKQTLSTSFTPRWSDSAARMR